MEAKSEKKKIYKGLVGKRFLTKKHLGVDLKKLGHLILLN